MPLLLVLFFCSGACGLAYQVLWMRQLSYVFGVTAYAASTVLAAFMAGLALGSWLAGPLLARIKRPLMAFGVAELLVGASAVATPAAFELASTLYRALYAAVPDAFLLQTAARFVCAFLVLLVPTLLMGLTLPLLSASSLVRGDCASARIGALYALNTAGAVTGTLLTGFVLIGALGMRRTFLAAAALNVLVGLVALALDRWQPKTLPDAQDALPQDLQPKAAADVSAAPRPIAIWAVMAASGFGSLALEVVWFRMMTQYVDATTYAFTTMLAVVLVGIAVGGAIASRVLTLETDWYGWLAATQIATGVLVLVGVHLMVRDNVSFVQGLSLGQRVMGAVLLPSLLMGFSFPLLLKLGVPASRTGESRSADQARGRTVGRFYGVNVLGAILGSLAGGFLILPWLGTRRSLVALAGIFVAAGVALCLTHARRLRMVPLGLAGAAAFAVLALAMPDPLAAASRVRTDDSSATNIFTEEGVQATVSVHSSPSRRTLVVGGLHQANDTEDMVRLHRSIGLLPMALHPRPASGLVIGLGGGATAGAMSQHEGSAVQIVELSESVRKAATLFSHVTYDVLNRPNVRIRVDDGRNFLLLSGEHFDVITADIIQPFYAGAGGLYSREYFELVRQALNPGGLALQWLSKREKLLYTLIMRTFLDVFPNATLWLNGRLIIGSVEPLRLDQRAFETKLANPQTRDALAAVGLGSYEALRAWYTAGPREMAAFVGHGPLLTDDLPLIEYHLSLPKNGETRDLKTIKGDVRDLDRP